MKTTIKTLEQACAENRANDEAWLEERNEKEKKVAEALPAEVPFVFRDVTQLDSALSFGQDIIILGYRSQGIENLGATYVYQGMATNLRASGNDAYERVNAYIEELKKQGIKPRAVFWGFGNVFSDRERQTERQIRDAVNLFGSDSSYQEKECAIRNIDRLFTGKDNYQKMNSQLEQLFAGKVDEKTLQTLTSDVDAQMQKVTLDTNSQGIIRFKSDGEAGYGKVSTNSKVLQNEHNALLEIKNAGLVSVLAPTPIGLALDENAGALFTWGTENRSKYPVEKVKEYFATFNTLLVSYAQTKGLNLVELAQDQNIQDVFNRALIHSSGINLNRNYGLEDIAPLEKLEQRACADVSLFRQLKQYNPIYIQASKRASEIEPAKPVFIHGDARAENVGRDPFGVRPLVDWANAGMGSAVAELAALETKDTQKYLDWYNFVMEMQGGPKISEESKDLVACYDVIQPYRVGSFKIGKGRIEEAEKDIQRLARNSQRYKQIFG
jgi:hypothetical protein